MNTKNRIGIYCNPKALPPIEILNQIIFQVEQMGGDIVFHDELHQKLTTIPERQFSEKTFCCPNDCVEKMDVLLSLGGDGTFLGTVPYVVEGNIPVIGINTGRMGFLANSTQNQIQETLKKWFTNNYQIDERLLIEVKSSKDSCTSSPHNHALNDITIRRSDNANMLSFNVEVNGQFLNNYWADGLIIATPTGSTAYSLSCGGPILAPDTSALIITPIASHNLTVRPLVVSDLSEIKITISGRSDHFSLSIDSQSFAIPIEETIIIKKSKSTIKTVQFKERTFYDTIRDKLSWGVDKRN